MTRSEAMRKIADLHTTWSLRHGDAVPYVSEHREADLAVHQADRSAPPEIDDPLNEAIKKILSQVDYG